MNQPENSPKPVVIRSTANERKVIFEFLNYTKCHAGIRSVAGVAKCTGLTEQEVQEVINLREQFFTRVIMVETDEVRYRLNAMIHFVGVPTEFPEEGI